LSFCAGAHRALPSFPTRRSSDLAKPHGRSSRPKPFPRYRTSRHTDQPVWARQPAEAQPLPRTWGKGSKDMSDPAVTSMINRALRSEEHTSELQSRENLVCRLLLE